MPLERRAAAITGPRRVELATEAIAALGSGQGAAAIDRVSGREAS